jgi:hypothetical protein
MRRNSIAKRLSIKKETLRELYAEELTPVAGGCTTLPATDASACCCGTDTRSKTCPP